MSYMTDSEIFELYMTGLKELRYTDCMKAVGILYYQNHNAAVMKDIEINFLIGNYEYVTRLAEQAREHDERNMEINEYYYASLALCGRFPKLRRELRKTKKNPVSQYCANFIQYVVVKNSEKIYEQFSARPNEKTPFRRLYLEFIFKELIDAYEMQKDLVEVYHDDSEEIRSHYSPIDEKIKLLYIASDSANRIKQSVTSRDVMDPMDIYSLFCECFKSEGHNKSGELLRITELRDILYMFELLRRLNLISELVNQVYLTEDIVFDAIAKQNKTAATYLKEVYYELLYDETLVNNQKTGVCNRCEHMLKENFPELLEDCQEKDISNNVYSLLSDKAKPMFRAAEWQYRAVLNDENYGFRDAGMLCLAYIRLLELEMNIRALSKIRSNYNSINIEFENNKPDDTAGNKKKKEFNYKWAVVNRFKPPLETNDQKGLTAGEWGMFLQTMHIESEKNSSSTLYQVISKTLSETVLNEKGMEALSNGELAAVFDQSTIVEKYRNPPAHTRYVTLDVATECKQYVESKLIFLEGLFK